MSLFHVGGLVLESAIPIPELTPAEQVPPDSTFRMVSLNGGAEIPCTWVQQWDAPGGQPWLSSGKMGSDYVLRFHDLFDFTISSNAHEVRCLAAPDTPHSTIRHFLLDHVVPRLLSLRGELVLHASALKTPEGAIAFIGKTGQGKSTLAGSLFLRGLRILTDDCLLIREDGEAVWISPVYPGLRLWPDAILALFKEEPITSEMTHYANKRRIHLDAHATGSSDERTPARVIYAIAGGDANGREPGISITPLSPRDAMLELFKNTYRMDLTDHKRLSDDLYRLGEIAQRLPVRRLEFPKNFEALPSVMEAIMVDAFGAGTVGRTQ